MKDNSKCITISLPSANLNLEVIVGIQNFWEMSITELKLNTRKIVEIRMLENIISLIIFLVQL